MSEAPELLPVGFRDRLAPAAERGAGIEASVLAVLASHGYERVDPPLAETESALVARSAAAVRTDHLRFTDPISQRTLALRTDMTTQIGRIAATRLSDAPRPMRLCYAGQVLRLRSSQLRPERQLTQIGAEIIGSDEIAAAREIVGLAIEALQAAGVTGITVDFTLPDLVDRLAETRYPLDADTLTAVKAELDSKDAGGLAALGAHDYLPLIAAAGPYHEALAKLEAQDAGGALASRLEALRAIAKPIADDIRLTLDPTERHGFEYQSWFGFTLYADGHVASLGRGGTYTLAHANGSEEPATGFSLYPDALADVLPAAAVQRLFLPMGHDMDIAAQLRADGWRTVAALSDTDDAATLGCTHRLNGREPLAI